MKCEPAPAWLAVFWDVLHGAGQRHVTRREPSLSRWFCSGKRRRRRRRRRRSSDFVCAEEGGLKDGKVQQLLPVGVFEPRGRHVSVCALTDERTNGLQTRLGFWGSQSPAGRTGSWTGPVWFYWSHRVFPILMTDEPKHEPRGAAH